MTCQSEFIKMVLKNPEAGTMTCKVLHSIITVLLLGVVMLAAHENARLRDENIALSIELLKLKAGRPYVEAAHKDQMSEVK